ncbi:MAG: hypothetical protein AVDCRST_MAG41-3059, partial [uncultured Corynebacteriales bacterium]
CGLLRSPGRTCRTPCWSRRTPQRPGTAKPCFGW